MRGADFGVLEASARRIERALPREQLSDAEDVLLALAGRFYTVTELARIVGRNRMWYQQSSLYVEGKADGRLEVARETCVEHAQKYHHAVFGRVEPLIAGCNDPVRLKEWTLAAPDVSDDEFLALLSTSTP